jgi:hypothetical protein
MMAGASYRSAQRLVNEPCATLSRRRAALSRTGNRRRSGRVVIRQSMARAAAIALAAALCGVTIDRLAAEARVLGRWSFEPPGAGTNGVAGGPEARIEKAAPADGHEGKGLTFEDWSVRNYIKPDPAQATRVVIPHADALNPAVPFSVSAWIYPTADPIYYGGIVEKGRGLGSSYRLVLLRGLKVQATLGDRHVAARSSEPLSLNAWHQVALKATADTLTLWIDGKQAALATVPPGTKVVSSDPVILGERFSGRIDELVISAD